MGENKEMWVARDADNGLWLYVDKPYKGLDEWEGESVLTDLNKNLFPNIKWEDEEPTEVEITIKENSYGRI